MNLLHRLFDLFSGQHMPLETTVCEEAAINPANGLPMLGGIGGMDIEGNPYGFDNHSSFTNSSSTFGFSSIDDSFTSVGSDWND